MPPSTGPEAERFSAIGTPGGSGGGTGGDGGVGGEGGGDGDGAGPGGGTGRCVLLPPIQTFQVPSGFAQCGPGDGAPNQSQQLLV